MQIAEHSSVFALWINFLSYAQSQYLRSTVTRSYRCDGTDACWQWQKPLCPTLWLWSLLITRACLHLSPLPRVQELLARLGEALPDTGCCCCARAANASFLSLRILVRLPNCAQYVKVEDIL